MVFTILLQAIYIPQQQFGCSTTYYGFYEFLQDDGIYANAFSSLQGNLIRFDDYSSSGGTQIHLSNTLIILIFPWCWRRNYWLNRNTICFLVYGRNAMLITFKGKELKSQPMTLLIFKQLGELIGLVPLTATTKRACTICNLTNGYIDTSGVLAVLTECESASFLDHHRRNYEKLKTICQ